MPAPTYACLNCRALVRTTSGPLASGPGITDSAATTCRNGIDVMNEAHIFVIGLLLAWLAGIRVYLTVFGVGLAGLMGWVELPSALQVTQSWWVLGISAVLTVVEFCADKIPGVDSIWDLLHTVARVPAGAFLAAATLSADGQLTGGALAAGAGVALTSHVIKAGTRALLNTSPEPASNWIASVTEDAMVAAALALALAHPWLALLLIIAASLAGALLAWWVWRLLWRGMQRLVSPLQSVASPDSPSAHS
jgi:uncharacterized membrane protein